MPDAKLKIKCLHDCKRVEEVMKNEDGPCKNSNRKNIAFHKRKFNQPIKHQTKEELHPICLHLISSSFHQKSQVLAQSDI